MVFQLRAADRALWFGLVFIVASYALMANVKYGMNLRYATMWDFSLRVLAVSQVALLAVRVEKRWQFPLWTAMLVALCAFDLNQYYRLAGAFPLYELVPSEMLHALQILK